MEKIFFALCSKYFFGRDYSHLVQRVSHERPGALLRGVAERVQAVAALQHEGHLAARQPRPLPRPRPGPAPPPRPRHQLVGEVGEARGADGVAADGVLVPARRVEARAHEHKVGVELARDRHDDGAEGGEVLGVPHGRLEAS